MHYYYINKKNSETETIYLKMILKFEKSTLQYLLVIKPIIITLYEGS